MKISFIRSKLPTLGRATLRRDDPRLQHVWLVPIFCQLSSSILLHVLMQIVVGVPRIGEPKRSEKFARSGLLTPERLKSSRLLSMITPGLRVDHQVATPQP